MRIVFAVIVVASTASAEPRYKRAAAVPPPPKTEKKVAKPAPAPTVTADAIIAGETNAQPIRLEQEKTLAKLAYDTPDSDPDKPEILFRLAELYAHQQLFWRLKAPSH